MSDPSLDNTFNEVLTRLQEDLRAIRTGRANADLVSNIMVEAYGSHTPLSQLASITATDATTIVVQPWDANVLKDVEKAIATSDTQLNPVNDGQVLRITLPALTEERRQELSKLVSQKGEETRIKIKQHREAALKEAKSAELSEDDLRKQQKDIQASVDRIHKEIDRTVSAKSEEILSL